MSGPLVLLGITAAMAIVGVVYYLLTNSTDHIPRK